jgi:hypothetical protein
MTRAQHPRESEPETSSGSGRFWMLLLLTLLVLVLLFYDQGAAKQYGEKAFAVTSRATHKVVSWSTNLYACGISGCAHHSAEITPAAVQVAAVNQNQATVSNTPPSPATPVVSIQNSTPQTPATPEAVSSPPPTLVSESSVATVPGTPVASEEPNFVKPPVPPPQNRMDLVHDHHGYHEDADQAPVAEDRGMPPPAVMTQAQQLSQQPSQSYFSPSPISRQEATPDPIDNDIPRVPEALKQARNSALAGRLDDSVHIYHQYLKGHPNDIDAHGELGNIYFHTGGFQQAAQHYYEAATRLIDAGQIDAATTLMPIIMQFEPRLASLLERKLSHATGDARSNPR